MYQLSLTEIFDKWVADLGKVYNGEVFSSQNTRKEFSEPATGVKPLTLQNTNPGGRSRSNH